jgi:serine/threonine protein kinase
VRQTWPPLWHPHIVGVHHRGEAEGQLWISMDYVDGLDASRLLSQRYPAGMPADEVADIVAAIASALDYAWRLARYVVLGVAHSAPAKKATMWWRWACRATTRYH